MQQQVQSIDRVVIATASERQGNEERWSMPATTLFVGGASLALWGGIYVAARLLFG